MLGRNRAAQMNPLTGSRRKPNDARSFQIFLYPVRFGTIAYPSFLCLECSADSEMNPILLWLILTVLFAHCTRKWSETIRFPLQGLGCVLIPKASASGGARAVADCIARGNPGLDLKLRRTRRRARIILSSIVLSLHVRTSFMRIRVIRVSPSFSMLNKKCSVIGKYCEEATADSRERSMKNKNETKIL